MITQRNAQHEERYFCLTTKKYRKKGTSQIMPMNVIFVLKESNPNHTTTCGGILPEDKIKVIVYQRIVFCKLSIENVAKFVFLDHQMRPHGRLMKPSDLTKFTRSTWCSFSHSTKISPVRVPV